MPTLDVSELNIIIAVLGATPYYLPKNLLLMIIRRFHYTVQSWISKDQANMVPWGALAALLVGIILGPIAAKFIDSERRGSAIQNQTEHITLVRLFAKLPPASLTCFRVWPVLSLAFNSSWWATNCPLNTPGIAVKTWLFFSSL